MDQSKLLPHQIISTDINIPYNSIYELLHKQTIKEANSVFLISPGNPEIKFTYNELHNLCLKFAEYYYDLGLRKGDRINLVIPNSPVFILMYFAAFRLGITVVPINHDIAPIEILYIIRYSESKAVFYDKVLDFKIQEIKDVVNKNTIIKSIPSIHEINDLLIEKGNSKIPFVEINILDEAVIIYTSDNRKSKRSYFNSFESFVRCQKLSQNGLNFLTTRELYVFYHYSIITVR